MDMLQQLAAGQNPQVRSMPRFSGIMHLFVRFVRNSGMPWQSAWRLSSCHTLACLWAYHLALSLHLPGACMQDMCKPLNMSAEH